MRWTLYDGGIARAGAQEQLRRVSEERFRLHQVSREVEEEVRRSWERLQREEELLRLLEEQLIFADEVVAGYRSQFEAGQRSLLDLLDAQNTRINVAQAYATSEHAYLFAQYRLLAAMGGLLDALGLEPVYAADDLEQGFLYVSVAAASEVAPGVAGIGIAAIGRGALADRARR